MIRYEIDELDIFKVWFEGRISLSDIEKYLLNFKKISNLSSDIRLLYDLTQCEINLLEDDLKNVAQFALEATAHYTSVRTAFLVSQPDIMAFTIIFTQIQDSEKNRRFVFSTYQAAIDWLLERE